MKGTWIEITTDYDVTKDILDAKHYYRINDKMFATLIDKSGLIYHNSKHSLGQTISVNDREFIGEDEVNKLILFLASIISDKDNKIEIVTTINRIRSGYNNTTNVLVNKSYTNKIPIEIVIFSDDKKTTIKTKDVRLLQITRKRTPFNIFFKEVHMSGYTVIKNNQSKIVHDYVTHR